MTIEQMRYFLEVVHSGSINKAGQNLHLKQQNLSRTIKSIEQELDLILLARNSKGIRLTPKGEEVAQRFEQILALYNEILLLNTTKPSPDDPLSQTGNLTYYSMADIWANTITNVIERFGAKYPNITVNVEETSIEQLLNLLNQQTDCIGKILLINNGKEKNITPRDDLLFYNCYPMQPVVYCAKNSDFANTYKSTSLKSLLNQQLVVYKPYAYGRTITEEFFAGIGSPNIRYLVSNAQAFYNILQHNDCITIGCHGPFNQPRQNDIAMIPIRDHIEIVSSFVIHKSSQHNPLINTFLNFQLDYIHANINNSR